MFIFNSDDNVMLTISQYFTNGLNFNLNVYFKIFRSIILNLFRLDPNKYYYLCLKIHDILKKRIKNNRMYYIM